MDFKKKNRDKIYKLFAYHAKLELTSLENQELL